MEENQQEIRVCLCVCVCFLRKNYRGEVYHGIPPNDFEEQKDTLMIAQFWGHWHMFRQVSDPIAGICGDFNVKPY